jgi:hypothetical protein
MARLPAMLPSWTGTVCLNTTLAPTSASSARKHNHIKMLVGQYFLFALIAYFIMLSWN